jgi:ABC-type Zn uptake system ZnuABC Zn-binding protein ZnuA
MGLDTIYSEELADPRLANVIAQEIPNGKVLVLSPIEGISKEEQNTGIGYLDKMNENINENIKGSQTIAVEKMQVRASSIMKSGKG